MPSEPYLELAQAVCGARDEPLRHRLHVGDLCADVLLQGQVERPNLLFNLLDRALGDAVGG